jgi:hypothetical protein
MTTLPKIRLWDEFWNYRLQPDKEAFAEVIRDWPPGLIARSKEVIKLRFGDERYTAPSIMEVMQNLGFWPLDAVSRRVLIELGNCADTLSTFWREARSMTSSASPQSQLMTARQ